MKPEMEFQGKWHQIVLCKKNVMGFLIVLATKHVF